MEVEDDDFDKPITPEFKAEMNGISRIVTEMLKSIERKSAHHGTGIMTSVITPLVAWMLAETIDLHEVTKEQFAEMGTKIVAQGYQAMIATMKDELEKIAS